MADSRKHLSLVSSEPDTSNAETLELGDEPSADLQYVRPGFFAPEVYQALSWMQSILGLEGFIGIDEFEAATGTGPARAVARFNNGQILLKQPSAGATLELDKAEVRFPGAAPIVFDRAIMRLAVAYRLREFNPSLSDGRLGRWTFGEPSSEVLGSAVLLKQSNGQIVLTLQPGTPHAAVLKDASYFVHPTFFAEDVMERVDVGRVVKIERQVVRCEDADILLVREPKVEKRTGCLIASAVRYPGTWPVPIEVFQLAGDLGFGAFVSARPGERVTFERGSFELQDGRVVSAKKSGGKVLEGAELPPTRTARG